MSIIAAAVKHMLASGMPHDAIVSAVAEMEMHSPAGDSRSKAAIRQANYRDRKASQTITKHNETSRNVTNVTDVTQGSPPEVFNDIYNSNFPNPPSKVIVSGRELQKLADEFYDAYPKKVDPPNAKQKFVKLCKSGIDPKLIIDAARRFANAHQLSGTEKQFIPAPAVWLNKGGYASEDLPAPARAGPDGNQLNGQQNQRQTGNSPLRGNHHAKPKTSVDYARELAEHFNPGLNTSGGSLAAMWDGPSLDLRAEADSIFPASGRA